MRALFARVVAVTLLVATAATPATAASADDSGLIVAPGSALFDVRLVPGLPESRLLTLTNTTDAPLDVYLTAELAAQSSPDHHFDDIVVHTDVATTCDGIAADTSRLVTLSHVAAVQQTVIAAHASESICVTAMVPAEVGSNKASTIVHFNFDAIQDGDDLATTGAEPPYLLLLLAVVLAIAGWFLTLRRRQMRDVATRQDLAANPAKPTLR